MTVSAKGRKAEKKSRRYTQEKRAMKFSDGYEIIPESGCWIWTKAMRPNGYGVFWNGDKVVGAHCFSWELKHGPVPVGHDVCHRCDVRSCVNPNHLFLGSRKDNMADAKEKGRIPSGRRHYACTLTDRTIKGILTATGTYSEIAKRFGVSAMTAWNVKNNTEKYLNG